MHRAFFKWSLPSNVNAGSLASYDPHFLEEARRKRSTRGGGLPEPMDVDDIETVSLLDHDSVAENFDRGPPTLELIENAQPQSAAKFTTKATLQVNVDDPLHFNDLETVEKKPYEIEQISAKVMQSQYSVFIQNYNPLNEAVKKVDENGNALHQNTTSKGKKKKIQADKNVVSCVAAEKVEGHRSDIINDVKKLLEYIGENKPQSGAPNKANAHRSNKQLHKHTSEDGPRSGKKQRAQSSKGKENRSELKKSNSLGEISTTKLEHFTFDGDDHDACSEQGKNDVVMRTKKDSVGDKPRERRSWGNVEHPGMQEFYKNPSSENVEVASSSDFRVVTKKKKAKKRRNSMSGSRRKPSNISSNCANSSKSDGDHASSPAPRRKSACSVPHSERSNDSSDVDSVHSLPIDTSQRMDSSLNSEDAPISYADIARNTERKQHEAAKKTPESNNKSKETSPVLVNEVNSPPEAVKPKITPHSLPETPLVSPGAPKTTAHVQSQTTPISTKAPPPDVHNFKSFPAIHATNNKLSKVEPKAVRGGGNNNKSQQGNKQTNMVQCNNVANVNRNVRTQGGNNNNNNNVQSGADLQNDLRNDLSIIQANEMDTIQYNSQIMPTMQIPDVQTIEKLHFMNQPGGHMPPHLQQHVLPPQHVHMAPPHRQAMNHHHQALPMVTMTEIYSNNRPPPAYTAVITHTPHQPIHGRVNYVKPGQAYEGVGVAYVDHAYMSPGEEGGHAHVVVPNVVAENQNNNLVTSSITAQTSYVVETKHKNLGSNNNNKPVDNENANSAKQSKSKQHNNNNKRQSVNETKSNNSNLDANKDLHGGATSPSAIQYAGSSSHSSPAPTVIANSDASTSFGGAVRQGSAPGRGGQEAEPAITPDPSAAANCDNRTCTSDCASSEDSTSDCTRPPVVILSGLSNREVTGLVFGFDVNEQLLSEDICENFEQRFIAPPTYSATSHNHDKIVNFIGLAWEEVRKNQSLGKAQYYTDAM